jgi:hypothetical protein
MVVERLVEDFHGSARYFFLWLQAMCISYRNIPPKPKPLDRNNKLTTTRAGLKSADAFVSSQDVNHVFARDLGGEFSAAATSRE